MQPRSFRSLGAGRGGGRPYEPWSIVHAKVMDKP